MSMALKRDPTFAIRKNHPVNRTVEEQIEEGQRSARESMKENKATEREGDEGGRSPSLLDRNNILGMSII